MTAPRDAEVEVRAQRRVTAAVALLGSETEADRGLVARVLLAAGQEIHVDPAQPYAAALHAHLLGEGARVEPGEVRAGDLVFFRNTSDLNENRLPDDGITMVGVVERREGARVLFVAWRAGKVRRMALDASQPKVVRDARDQVTNTRLVRWPGAAAPLTTGQCLAGYARPD